MRLLLGTAAFGYFDFAGAKKVSNYIWVGGSGWGKPGGQVEGVMCWVIEE